MRFDHRFSDVASVVAHRKRGARDSGSCGDVLVQYVATTPGASLEAEAWCRAIADAQVWRSMHGVYHFAGGFTLSDLRNGGQKDAWGGHLQSRYPGMGPSNVRLSAAMG